MTEPILSRRAWLRLVLRGAAGCALAAVSVLLLRRERRGSATADCSRGQICGGCPSGPRCPLPAAAEWRDAGRAQSTPGGAQEVRS